jgi:tRNA-modifying protein YgfZ
MSWMIAPRALHEHTHLFDLTGRGSIAVTGKDRAAFLHGLVTADVRKLVPGMGSYAAFLTPKGKMLADLTILASAGELFVDCDAELAAKIAGLLAKYLIFQEAAVADRTLETAVLHVEGPGAVEVLARAEIASLPAAPHAHVPSILAGAEVLVALESRAGEAGYDIRLPRAAAAEAARALERAGALRASADVLEAGRIEAGIPRWGAELDESVLPDEAGLRERGAIADNKGCYIGQETVARIKTYGHVNRRLVALLLAPGAAVSRGAEVKNGEEKAGAVTSAVRSERRAETIALAFVKRDLAAPGTRLLVETPSGATEAAVAAVADLPLVG